MSLASQVSALATRVGGEVKSLWVAVNAKAPTASPTFTGTPAAPTAAADTNTTQVATTAFVVGQGYLKSSGYTASDVLTKVKTVDGSGSGLDADLLDGQHGSYYATAASVTDKPDLFAQSTEPASMGNLDFWLDTSATA